MNLSYGYETIKCPDCSSNPDVYQDVITGKWYFPRCSILSVQNLGVAVARKTTQRREAGVYTALFHGHASLAQIIVHCKPAHALQITAMKK